MTNLTKIGMFGTIALTCMLAGSFLIKTPQVNSDEISSVITTESQVITTSENDKMFLQDDFVVTEVISEEDVPTNKTTEAAEYVEIEVGQTIEIAFESVAGAYFTADCDNEIVSINVENETVFITANSEGESLVTVKAKNDDTVFAENDFLFSITQHEETTVAVRSAPKPVESPVETTRATTAETTAETTRATTAETTAETTRATTAETTVETTRATTAETTAETTRATTVETTTEATTVATTAAPAPVYTSTNSSVEQRVVDLVNEERERLGLNPLSNYNSLLNSAADTRAMEIEDKFSHTRPNGEKCFTAMKELGLTYTLAGENIAYGQPTAERVVEAWINSPDHYENLINPRFTQIGVGAYEKNGVWYWAQFFMK